MNLPSGSSQRFLVQIWLTYFFFFPTVTIIWVLSENWTINFMFRWSKINQDHRIIYTELCIVTCKYSSVCNYNVQGSYCLSLKIGRKKKLVPHNWKSLRFCHFLLRIYKHCIYIFPLKLANPVIFTTYFIHFNTLKQKIYYTSVFVHIFKDMAMFTDPPRFKIKYDSIY